LEIRIQISERHENPYLRGSLHHTIRVRVRVRVRVRAEGLKGCLHDRPLPPWLRESMCLELLVLGLGSGLAVRVGESVAR